MNRDEQLEDAYCYYSWSNQKRRYMIPYKLWILVFVSAWITAIIITFIIWFFFGYTLNL